MKKIVSMICIMLLIAIEICIPINSYAQEKEENIQNTEINSTEDKQENKKEDENTNNNNVVSDEEIDKVEDNTIQNQVEGNVVNEENGENEQIDEINEIENSIVEEENLDELNLEENKMKVQARMNVIGSETIVDGTTNRITTKLTGRVVGTDGGSEENGADINLWDDVSVSQQRFKFVYYEEGYYKIINEKSGKLLDVVGSGLESGTPVDQWEDNGGYDNQKWIVQDAGNGYYNIISKLNGLYLTVDGNGANCDLLCVKSATGGDDQKFQIVEKGTPQGEKTVEEGIYKIVLATAPTQSLTVDGGKTNDGVNVHIWEYQNVLHQQFELVYDGNGYYEIIPVHSGKRLDVVGYGNEANVDQWSENGGNDNQKWVIRESKLGNYNIISKRDSLFLDAYQSKTANGTNIEVYEQSRGNGQEFKLEKIEKEEIEYGKTVEEGTYKIVLARAPTQSLTVDGGKTNDGANVHIWEYVDSLQQQFNLVYDGNGYYEIIPVHSGKRIDVVGYGNEANVDQWANNGGNDNQKWAIVKSESGNYNIISQRDGLYLDAYQSKTADGTNIQVYEKSGGIGQEFKLEKIENKSERTIADGTYKIAVQANTNLVVEASGSNTDNDGRIQIWQDFNAKAQKLKIEYVNGYYKILLGHSEKSLTVKWRNISSGTEIVQYEWNEGDNQKWIIRDNGDGSVGIIPLSDYSLTIDIGGAIENGSKLELYNNEKNVKQRFTLIKSNLGVNIDMDKYPGIGEAVDKLVSAHPNWQFEILYTGLDFYTAVQGEYDYAGRTANLVHTATYQGEWIAPNPVVNGSWASASYSAIAYFMDPRNILNEIDVFQFVDLADYASSGATWDSIQYQVAGTFLDGYTADVMAACEVTNINPYFVLARLFQEQGYNGSDTINMDGGDGKLYYNPFNISASVGDEVNTALAKAKQEGWDTMQKGLEGGIRVLKEGYIDANQNTLYLNKFDVNPNSPGGFYSHQYMQNLSAAYSEARIFRGAYEDTGTLDNTIKFIIPVYENMPKTPSARPSGGGSTITSDTGPISVQVRQTDMGLALRSEPNTTSNLIGDRLPTGTQLISIERLNTGWHKVITLDGRMGYCSADYLDIINDINICNERIMVDSSNGTNVRTGPSTDSNIIKAVGNRTTGTRLIKGIWNADGYWWDLVLLDDGTKGFVATNWLKVI